MAKASCTLKAFGRLYVYIQMVVDYRNSQLRFKRKFKMFSPRIIFGNYLLPAKASTKLILLKSRCG